MSKKNADSSKEVLVGNSCSPDELVAASLDEAVALTGMKIVVGLTRPKSPQEPLRYRRLIATSSEILETKPC
jgi:hypothetical protein